MMIYIFIRTEPLERAENGVRSENGIGIKDLPRKCLAIEATEPANSASLLPNKNVTVFLQRLRSYTCTSINICPLNRTSLNLSNIRSPPEVPNV